MNAPAHRFRYGSTYVDRRVPLPESLFQATAASFDSLLHTARFAADDWAYDLLTVAKAVYLADRHSRRKDTDDHWTRSIDLQIPLAVPEAWDGTPTSALHELLTLLTGDRWTIQLTHGGAANGVDPLFDCPPAEEIALFSGGLDSTSYAAVRSQQCTPDQILFIGYYHNPLKDRVENVLNNVWPEAHYRAVLQDVRKPREYSNRSRGLLYIATAVWVASAHRTDSVTVPENGQLAINPPLTAGRPGACSTHSVHPHTLELINQIIASIGGTVRVSNPFAYRTKGEVCDLARQAGMCPDAFWHTVSCGHPPSNDGAIIRAHCGQCFPCLVRRSSLHHAIGTDGSDYKTSQFWSRNHNDVFALYLWLANPFSFRDLIADVPLPTDVDPTRLFGMLRRGRAELANLFTDVPMSHPLHLDRAA